MWLPSASQTIIPCRYEAISKGPWIPSFVNIARNRKLKVIPHLLFFAVLTGIVLCTAVRICLAVVPPGRHHITG